MSEARKAILEYRDRLAAVQSTGCPGAAGYLDYAREHGYKYVEPLNQCSSAGDWQFLVSKDGQEWYILCQNNNYPRAGFSWHIYRGRFNEIVFYGTLDEVHEQIDDLSEGW